MQRSSDCSQCDVVLSRKPCERVSGKCIRLRFITPGQQGLTSKARRFLSILGGTPALTYLDAKYVGSKCFDPGVRRAEAAQQQPPTTVAVGVVKAERRPIAKAGDFVGRVEAISRVEIRARIAGFLEKVLEGDLIKE